MIPVISQFFVKGFTFSHFIYKQKDLKILFLRQLSAFHLQSKTYQIDLEKGKKNQLYFNKERLHKMINGKEEVCFLENWIHDTSMIDKNLEPNLLLQDPYDSIWLKIIAILSYLIGLVASAVMNAFVNYENGHHGNFRTVINQLLSTLYVVVS